VPLDSPLVHRARELARVAHADHFRKAPKVPYFEHLEAVAHLLAEHGYDDDVQLAAAYLHDLLEDRPAYGDLLRAEMPVEVVRTVEVLTERKTDARGRPRPKRARFDRYVQALRAHTPAAIRARPISCADKIHNTRSLAAAEREGHALLLKLSTRPGEHEAQLETLREIYAPSVNGALLASFDAATKELLATLEAWLPGRAVMIAAEALLGQRDAAGAPAVHRPLRRMLRAEGAEAQMTAVLWEVVQAGRRTPEALAREGFSPPVRRALEHLARRPDEPDGAYVARVAQDRLAARVALLELESDAGPGSLPADAAEPLKRALRERTLWIGLDDESVEAVRRLAVHPVVRGDHVTLAHRVDPEAVDETALVPTGAAVGEPVTLRAVAEHRDARLQALVVEIEGRSVRPFDGGTLHVTVSRVEAARSKDANDLIARTEPRPLEPLALRGRVEWVDR
jgi:hypothetical protein